jgi:hypothetical protein
VGAALERKIGVGCIWKMFLGVGDRERGVEDEK